LTKFLASPEEEIAVVARSMTDKIFDHELAESSRFYIDRILGMSGSRKESGGGGVG